MSTMKTSIPVRKPVNLSLEETVVEAARAHVAGKRGDSVSALVERLLISHLKRNNVNARSRATA